MAIRSWYARCWSPYAVRFALGDPFALVDTRLRLGYDGRMGNKRNDGIVWPDGRGRLALGPYLDDRFTSYAVDVSSDGSIILTPALTISVRELAVLRDPELSAQLEHGMTEAAEGNLVDLGTFTEPGLNMSRRTVTNSRIVETGENGGPINLDYDPDTDPEKDTPND